MNKENTETSCIDPDDIPDLSTPEWEEVISATTVRRGRGGNLARMMWCEKL